MLTPSLKGRALAATALVVVYFNRRFCADISRPTCCCRRRRRRGTGKEAVESHLGSRQRALPIQLGTERRSRQANTLHSERATRDAVLADPKLNLIARVIVPFVSQPPLFEGGTAASGVSDILTSFFFSPNTGSTSPGAPVR